MEKQKKKVRFVYRRSSLATKIIVLATVLLCIAALICVWAMTEKLEKQNAQESTNATQSAQKNLELEQDIKDVGTEKGMDKIAREELDLYPEDAIIFETTQ